MNDYVTEIIPDYNVIESGNCGMKFECADGTCIDAEGKIFLPIFSLKYAPDTFQLKEGCCALWQYGFWSFQMGGTKLERF